MYDYEKEKLNIFTEESQREFLQVRDQAGKLLQDAGAFMMFSATKGLSGSSWKIMAYVDRLVELGEIREITDAGVRGQDRVFVKVGPY